MDRIDSEMRQCVVCDVHFTDILPNHRLNEKNDYKKIFGSFQCDLKIFVG